MPEPRSPGWFYRLTPRMVLRTPRHPDWPEAAVRVLLVRSGAAFPAGHPTTRLCLDLLREALAANPAGRLADVGCGAGVLSLAAAALGVPRVLGVDISPDAVRVTRRNARENGLADSIMVAQGSSDCLKGRFDLVAANLPWEVQMAKVAELHRLSAEGRLILSGFHDNREGPLLERYRCLGRLLKRRLLKEFHHPELPADISFTWVAWLLE